MQIPKLANAERRREFDDYSHEEHVKVIKAYLFDGMSYRKIDRMVLKLDENHTRVWKSMGMLHYTGLYEALLPTGLDIPPANVDRSFWLYVAVFVVPLDHRSAIGQ